MAGTSRFFFQEQEAVMSAKCESVDVVGVEMLGEDLVLFSEAGAAFPAGRNPSPATLHRWRLRGVCGGVVLETIKIGNSRYTSRQAIQRFIAAQNSSEQKPELTAEERRARSVAARAVLAGRGI